MKIKNRKLSGDTSPPYVFLFYNLNQVKNIYEKVNFIYSYGIHFF